LKTIEDDDIDVRKPQLENDHMIESFNS